MSVCDQSVHISYSPRSAYHQQSAKSGGNKKACAQREAPTEGGTRSEGFVRAIMSEAGPREGEKDAGLRRAVRERARSIAA